MSQDFCDATVLNGVLRFLIKAAEDKRVVPYYELENAFGLSHKMCSFYAGQVGHYCEDKGLPLLNSLLVNSSTCKPSSGFDTFPERAGLSWTDCLAACWSTFHRTSTRTSQSGNYSGLNQVVREWVKNNDVV